MSRQSASKGQTAYFERRFHVSRWLVWIMLARRAGDTPRLRTRLLPAAGRGFAALLLLALAWVPLEAQTLAPGWFQQAPQTSPPARYIHAMTYDQGHAQVVLFGGYGEGNYLSDTWLWSGTNWTQANPANSPSPRAAHSMAYDAAHGQVVLFGGLASVSSRLGDTWLWNGANWTQAAPANSPPARDGAMMAYIPGSGVLLFGGVNNSGFELNDTWLWNGTNWTQLSPSSSPSVRADASMVYDPALGEVILFGGSSNGTDLNDTWLWNGQSWSQSAPAAAPPARDAQGMDYDPALGKIVMFGGYNGSFPDDTWVFGPVNGGTTWTQVTTATSPVGRYAPNAVVYDAALNQVVLFAGLGTGNQLDDTWEFGLPGNFGNVNVCPTGNTAAAPCGETVSFPYNLSGPTSFGAPQVVTQGAPSLDFQLAAGSTCTGPLQAGSCTVNVTFAPLTPGLRMGAIEILSSTGNVLANTSLYGVGNGPAAAIGPGTQSVVNTTSAFTLSGPKGVTVDAAGDVFISDVGNSRVVKVAAGGAVSTVGTGLNFPQGLAVDGAGDLFIADNNLNEIVEVPAGCLSSTCQQVLGANVRSQLGVAVDGAGDVFFSDFLDGEVVESPVGCAYVSCQIVVYNPASANPVGLAVDGAGDLFIADVGLKQVVEIPAGCTTSSCQVKVGTGVIAPQAVAVDAAGDVFIADAGLNAVIEVPAGCTNGSCQLTVVNGISAFGLALDAQGDVFVPDHNNSQIREVLRSQGPSLTFATTNAGSTSSDSPQSVFLQNIGNQMLSAVGSGLVVAGPNFSQVPGSGAPLDCSASFALVPGAACDLSLDFDPITGGNPLTSSAVFSDNALNATAAKQAIALSGVAVAQNFALSVTEIGSGSGAITDSVGQIDCVESNGTSSGTCATNYAAVASVTLTETSSGTSIFLGWGGICASSGTNPTCSVTASQAGNATASFVNQNFGNINVCPVSTNAGAPCATTLPVTFNLANTTHLGALQVVTEGISGLDFAAASGSSCTGTVIGGSSCSVNVTFSPLAPGLRMAAVQLFDNNANLVASAPIYGVGQGPAITFGPGTQTTLVPALASAASGVVVDAAGDIFVAGGLGALKLTPSGIQSTVPLSGVGPVGLYDVALDGAGDLYFADTSNNRVIELTPTGIQSTVPTTGLSEPTGVAVDGSGNLFITDLNNNRVVKITAAGVQSTVPTNGVLRPYYPAVDGAGNVFFLDSGNERVLKVTPAGVQSTIPVSGLVSGNGLAVDAAGDVYVSDQLANVIFEVTPIGSQTIVPTSGLNVPAGLALDAAGDVFIALNGQSRLVEVVRSQVPSLSFALTNVGSTSSDSPRTVSIQNVGNQPLLGALALNLGSALTQSVTPDCSAAFPLAPSATCIESFSFSPQSATFFSGTAAFTDNTFGNTVSATQTITLSGTGAVGGVAGTVAVPSVVGMAQTAAASPLVTAGLALGTITTQSSSTVAAGNVIDQNPEPGTQVNVGTAVNLLVSSGQAQPVSANPLSLNNNYLVTGDYVTAGVTLRGTGVNGTATGTITIPTYNQSATEGVPQGADILDAFLYWETLENTPAASSFTATFNGYSVVGQQIGNDMPNYVDGAFTGTIRAYRADVNIYLPVGANAIRLASGNYTIGLPDSGGTGLPLTEGASLVVLYRVLSPDFPLKAVVLYDGAALPGTPGAQVVQGFYDAVGGAGGSGKSTTLFASGGTWNNNVNAAVALGQSNQYSAPLNAGNAYAAVILSTPVNNSDNDGILDAWKAGPAAGDFHAGQPGYYDVKTSTWVGLPGAKHGQKDLFVQLDYMCGAVLASGACDPTQENLFPSPDANGQDPLAMVQQAFAASGVALHLTIGNAVPESTCQDNLSVSPVELCQFPNEPGVVGWKNSIEFAKLYPRNLAGCLSGGDCTTRYPFGQKDSYHYVLFGHSLAIPAWNTPSKTLISINVANGVTTLVTTDRGTGINACPSRVTISGVLGNPSLNGVYNTSSCADTQTITLLTPGVPNWSYPNTALPEPVIGLTSGTVTSISGYSDLGGADSAVTLGLWLTAPNQNMARRANVLAGTLFHEIGHTIGLSHGGLYYDTPGTSIPTFDGNCKPNYQSVMNYLFQLDLLGPNQTLAFSNQSLLPINENAAGSITQLTDAGGNAATFPTSAWYVPWTSSSTVSAATMHCDGTPLNGELGYRVDAPVDPIAPAWTNGQDLSFTGNIQSNERGYNDLANMDLRQVSAVSGEFVSLASLLSFGSSVTPLNISAGGTVALGSGGTVALGSGGTVTLGSGGNVTLGSGGTVTLGSGGTVTLGSGGTVTLGSGGTVTAGSSGTVALGSGGTVTLGSGGTITLGSGGTVTLGSGGTVTLGSGGTVTLGSGGSVTIPSSGGSYTIDGSGGTVTLGSGGTVTLGSGGTVALGSGGTIALGSGGTVTLGSGGTVTLGSGGTVALGSGGTVALGSGGNVTLGSGGTVTLGSGGTVTLGSGGTVTLGSGGTVTLGSGGTVALGSGGNVTLGSGGEATLGAGGTVTLGSGGTLTLGSGGTITFGSGGTVTLGSGGTVVLGSGFAPSHVGAGGTVILGSGGTVTLGSGGTIALGSGGTVTLGSGGVVTLGSGGVVTLGNNGSINLGTGSDVSLGSVNNVTPGSGGPAANELTYETANSIVRPPVSPTETPSSGGVLVTWQAPAFGVVQTYTVSRSSDNATPIVIGSVSGVGGNPPATQFLDANPDLTSATVVYTITTTLVPDSNGPSRQSVPSLPAAVKNNQSISLGPLPSSVLINTSPTITATAISGGLPNGLQVVFTATGVCSIASQTLANNVSSAIVSLSTTGSCTVTATQPGATAFNAANSVSGTFMVLPQGSTTQSQTVSFPALQNVQYGNTFSFSASSSAGLPVSFTASGPCMTSGTVSGVGVCKITASAPASSTYSAASVTQSFNVLPAVLKVTASNVSSKYGQPLPALTYAYTGFQNGDTVAVVSGAPALSTSATSTSDAGNYPITVSTGTMAATNYSFLYVSGTLTVQPANQAQLTLTTSSPLTFGQSETLSATGGSTGGTVTYNLIAGSCTITGATLTAGSGSGACQVTATMAGSNDYNAVTSTPANTVALSPASQTINFTTNPPSTAAYGSHFTVAATATSGGAVMFMSAGACSNSGATYTLTSGTGSCSVIANQSGNANYAAASPVTKTVAATLATPATTFTGAPASAAYHSTFTVAASTNASTTAVITSSGACSNSGTLVTMTSGTGTCLLNATWPADMHFSVATAKQSTTATLATQTITFTAAPPATAAYSASFTVAATSTSGGAVTFTSAGACSNSGAMFTMISGTGSCSVIANQGGTSNYSAAPQVVKTVSATLAVPVVTWPAPAPIVYGYPLTTKQLDATASVSGTFLYAPAAGAVVPIGTQTLSVTFTPASPMNYSTVTASVPLTVTAPTVSLSVSSTTETYQQWTNFVVGPIYSESRVPTGTVTLYNNGAALTTLPLGGNGLAYYTAGPFNVGANVITATYSGNSYFPPGVSSPVTITVRPALVNFQASCWGAEIYGVPYLCITDVSASTSIAPGGVITYSFDGGAAVSVPIFYGLAAFTLPQKPNAGNHTLVLNYAAQGNFAAAGPITKTFTTQQAATELFASPSSYYLASASPLTISGKATTPCSGVPPGSVTVYDGNTVLGTAPIGSDGSISYKINSISKGPHRYSLSYPGSANYKSANSGSSAVTAY